MRGKTYQFIANGISTFHPFMIIYNKGTVSSSSISGNSGSFTITMSIDDNENSYYRCLNHSGMKGNLSFLYGTVDNFEYNFYYGDIDVIVDNDFKKVSIYCYYHGFMGGQDLLIYTSNCEIPEPESEPESESESEPEPEESESEPEPEPEESEPESEESEPESEPEESEPEPEESEPEPEPEEPESEPESESQSEPETDIILGPIHIVYATRSNIDNTQSSETITGYTDIDAFVWGQLGSDINGDAAGDNSGKAVALSSDGTIVAIGGVNGSTAGSAPTDVRVFEYDGTSWNQLGSSIQSGDYVVSDSQWGNDQRDRFLDLSSDGTILATGFHEYNVIGHTRL